MKKILLILIFNIVLSQVTTDQTFTTSRSLSMAGSVVSNPSYTESIFFNPAGLALADSHAFLIGELDHYSLEFINFSYASFVYQSKELGNLGFGVQQFGTQGKREDDNGGYEDIYLSSEIALSFAQGFSLLNDRNSSLHLGYTLNGFILKQASSAGSLGDGTNGLEKKDLYNVGIDVGLLASLRNKMQVGVFIKNINSPSMGRGSTLQYLPRKLVMGISYMPLEKLNTHFNLETLLGYKDMHFSFGFEYRLNHMFVLNSGIMIKPNRFGFGFSYSPTKEVVISFGTLTHPVLPVSNSLEIGFKF